MVSSELPEIMAISDRVYVMRDGTYSRENLRQKKLLRKN